MSEEKRDQIGGNVKSNTAKLTLGIAAALMLQACNLDFSQDPLKNESEAVQNAQIKEEAPPPPPKKTAAIRPEELHIDILGSVAEYFSFVEGREGKQEVGGRVLTPNADYELSVDNLADFEGATFDAAKGVFTWTPPFNRSIQDYAQSKTLTVRLTAKSPQGERPISTTRDIPVLVYRAERDPLIVAVSQPPALGFIREGARHVYEVIVRDPESTGTGSEPPRLSVIPAVTGAADISRHVYVQEGTTDIPNPTQDPNDRSLWTFRVLVDLSAPQGQAARGPDYTASQASFSFGLKVVGRFGNTFQSTQAIEVRTSLMKPQSTWTPTDANRLIEFKAGTENAFQFQVFDRRSEGKIVALFETRLDRIGGVASCETRPSSTLGDVMCRILATPDASILGQLSPCPVPPRNQLTGPKDCLPVVMDLRNQLDVNGEPMLERETMTRYIRIVK